MKKIAFIIIASVILGFVVALLFAKIVGAEEISPTNELPERITLPNRVGESVTAVMPDGVVIEITLESSSLIIDTGDPMNPDDDYGISENTFGTRIKYPLYGWVAWKKLWIKAEWWIGEDIVRVLAAASPNIILKRQDLFHWEHIAQDITSSGWTEGLVRYSAAKLWCDIPFCKDWSYEIECYLYGSIPGLFDCYRQKW